VKTAFIIHGAYGKSRENWFSWLKEELEKEGYQVYVPDFLHPVIKALTRGCISLRNIRYRFLQTLSLLDIAWVVLLS
jgi:predicted alpha/beta-fold hydrolase